MSDHKKKKKKKEKKISITYQQGNLSGVLPAFMHHFLACKSFVNHIF